MLVCGLLVVCAVGLSGSVSASAQDAEPASPDSRGAIYERVTEAVTPALVRVEFIVSMESNWGGPSEDSEMESDGVLVSEDGVVLLANSAIGGWMAMLFETQANPRDVKVMIGDDTEGVPATVIARDSDRDLCWIKLDEALETPLPHIDITAPGEEPALGETVYQVTRLGEYFGRATVVTEATVNARLTKPRDLLHVGMGSAEPGLPVVNSDGSFAGFTII